jgi:hypothetical protein
MPAHHSRCFYRRRTVEAERLTSLLPRPRGRTPGIREIYGMSWAAYSGLMLAVRTILGFICDELAEVGRRAGKCAGSEFGNSRLDLKIGKSSVNFLIELEHSFGGYIFRRGDTEPFGMSGRSPQRLLAVTASARNVPNRRWRAADRVAHHSGTSLSIATGEDLGSISNLIVIVS